jgi:hypothetical protein
MFNVVVFKPVPYESFVYHVDVGGDGIVRFLVWNVTASPPRFELIEASGTTPTMQVSLDINVQRRIAEYKLLELKKMEDAKHV